MTNEHCKGCSSDSYYGNGFVGSCKFNGYNDSGQCPCSRCIIKMMCNKTCEAFENFTIGIV